MSKKLKFLAMVLTCILLSINQMWGATGAITISNEIIIPAGNTTNITKSYWSGAGAPSYSTSNDVVNSITIGSTNIGSLRFYHAGYDSDASKWCGLASGGGYLETVITSTAGVDVVVYCKRGGSKTGNVTVTLTGGTTQTTTGTSWATLSISTTSTTATLKIANGANNQGIVGYIRITPKASSGKTVYLDASYFGESDKFGVWSWKDGASPADEKMSDAFMTSVSECRSNIYKADIPSNHDRVIFLHCSSGSTPAWDAKDKQTVNLTPGDNNFFTVSSGSGDSYDGSWGTYATNVTVSFNKNTSANGVEDPDDQCVAKSSGKATAPTISDMSHGRLGYQLSGWYENAGGTGSAWNFSTGTFSADKTLYAKWTAGATTTVALLPTWSGDGNTWDKDNAIIFAHFYIDGTTQAQDVQMTKNVCDGVFTAEAPYGTTHISFARCTSGTVAGDLTGDWATNDHVQNCVYGCEMGGSYYYSVLNWGSYGQKAGGKQRNDAAYTPSTFTISFAAGTGGSGGPMASITSIACDANQTLTANGFTAPTGHTFDAWHANVDVTVGGSPVEAGEDIADGATIQNIRSNIALTAQWKYSVYTITYKDKGGGAFSGTHATGKPTTHTYGTETTLKSASKSYNTFDGWYTNIDCTGDPVTSLGATAYTDNITLYAKWTPKVDQFIDDLQETTGYTSASPHEETGAYSMPGPLSNGDKETGNDCRKAHYKFVGWVTAGGQNTNGTIKGTPKIWQPGESNSANNQTYYAVWAEEE